MSGIDNRKQLTRWIQTNKYNCDKYTKIFMFEATKLRWEGEKLENLIVCKRTKNVNEQTVSDKVEKYYMFYMSY